MMSFDDYLIKSFGRIPQEVYILLSIVFIVCSSLLLVLYGWKKGYKLSLLLLFAEYICILMCSTVIYRKPLKKCDFHFKPFWSYYTNNSEHITLLPEHIMNIVVFIPIGTLLGSVVKRNILFKSMIIGCSFSIFIETLQFVFKRGICEIDDVINNTLGCLLGSGLTAMVKR